MPESFSNLDMENA